MMDRSELDRLVKQLNYALPLMVLLGCAVMATGYYWLHLKPSTELTMEREQQTASAQVEAKFQGLAGQVERVLLTTRDWGQADLLAFDDPKAFNRLLLPILRQRVVTSSVHYARDDGREIMLLKGEGAWKNRVTDFWGKGRQQRWIEWRNEWTPTSDEYLDQDYDPRQRPWFKGAIGAPPGEVYWTEPYIFKTTGDPGITLSMRWLDSSGRSNVVAYDILLADLSQFTGGVAYGKRGYAALLTEQGKLLGVPKLPQFSDAAALKAAVFKTPDEAGLPLLGEALRAFDPKREAEPEILTEAGENWRVMLKSLPVRNQRFTVAVLAPTADFAVLSARAAWSLSILILLLLGAMFWIARRFSLRFGKPIVQLFDDLAVSQTHLERQFAAKSLLADVAYRLQHAATRDEVGRQVLTQLAERLGCRQGLVAALNATGELEVAARYGAPPESARPERYGLDDGMIGQCAREGKPLMVALPEDAAWRIRSGLGSGAPAEIRVLPIKHGGELVGVLEVGFAEPLDAAGEAVLEQLLPIVALPLHALHGAAAE